MHFTYRKNYLIYGSDSIIDNVQYMHSKHKMIFN